MPPNAAALSRYFVQPGDLVQAAEEPSLNDIAITDHTLPETEEGSRVTHLIDGANYFGALRQEVAALLAGGSDRFFYTSSWALGTSATPGMVPIGEGSVTSAWKEDAAMYGVQEPFQLTDQSPGPFHLFKTDLEQMADAGVDVRVFVWASPFLVNFEQAARAGGTYTLQYWGTNVHSLRSLLDLRQGPELHDKIVIDTLAHTLGSIHIKMTICGDATGFRAYVGGIDFTQARIAFPMHKPNDDGSFNGWHDVMVKVEGLAANGLFRCFSELWDEQVTRTPKVFKAFGEKIASHFEATPLTPQRFAPAVAGGTCHTQVLETLPTANFATFGNDRTPLVGGKIGEIPVLRALVDCFKRSVTGFKQQKLSFAPGGRFEFRAGLRKAVMAAERYIYIEDQAMENVELGGWINQRLRDAPGLKVIMLYGGDPADPPSPDLPTFVARIVKDIADAAERVVFVTANFIVHAKVTIIDDVWAVVGSSNCWERSFYTDGELNVAVVDDADPPFAARLRKDLWGEHCNKEPGADCDPLLPLGDALGIWRDSWGSAPFPLDTVRLSKKTVPFLFVMRPFPKPAGWEPPEGQWAIDESEPDPPTRPVPLPQSEREQKQAADSRLEY